jgi:hypothetical protein
MDRKRKKELKRQWQAQERSAAYAALPLWTDDMRAMFDWLNFAVPGFSCDHTRIMTIDWLKQNGHPVEKVLAWLDDNGGHCDCEILLNCEERFLDAVKPRAQSER